jgi:hypothetical protein
MNVAQPPCVSPGSNVQLSQFVLPGWQILQRTATLQLFVNVPVNGVPEEQTPVVVSGVNEPPMQLLMFWHVVVPEPDEPPLDDPPLDPPEELPPEELPLGAVPSLHQPVLHVETFVSNMHMRPLSRQL